MGSARESLTSATGVVSSFAERIHYLVTGSACWSAIMLPVLYLPVLSSGVKTTTGLIALAALFGLHILVLIAGHGYQSPLA